MQHIMDYTTRLACVGYRCATTIPLVLSATLQRVSASTMGISWRDAVRGARWGLEYIDFIRDIWASELTPQWYVIRENVKTCSGWEVQDHRDIFCLLGGLAPSACLSLLFPDHHPTLYWQKGSNAQFLYQELVRLPGPWPSSHRLPNGIIMALLWEFMAIYGTSIKKECLSWPRLEALDMCLPGPWPSSTPSGSCQSTGNVRLYVSVHACVYM